MTNPRMKHLAAGGGIPGRSLMTSSIKVKLLTAALLVLLLAAFAQRSGASAALAARIALGLAALAGLVAWWIWPRPGAGRPFRLPPRLSVAARTGLSPRCGVALVEVDGGRYLVAYGDGFAQLLNALPPARPPTHARTGRRIRAPRVEDRHARSHEHRDEELSFQAPRAGGRIAHPDAALGAQAPRAGGLIAHPGAKRRVRNSPRGSRS